MIQFCMASILATFVLDDEAMALVNKRKECHIIFQACIVLLESTLNVLKPEMEVSHRSEEQKKEFMAKQDLNVRLAEGCAQALWGAAYFCVLEDTSQINHSHIALLAEMGLEAVKNETVCSCRSHETTH